MGDRYEVLLSEIMTEIRRANDRFEDAVVELKHKDDAQDEKIGEVTKFMNRSIGTIGAISFVAFVGSFVTGVLTFIFR